MYFGHLYLALQQIWRIWPQVIPSKSYAQNGLAGTHKTQEIQVVQIRDKINNSPESKNKFLGGDDLGLKGSVTNLGGKQAEIIIFSSLFTIYLLKDINRAKSME